MIYHNIHYIVLQFKQGGEVENRALSFVTRTGYSLSNSNIGVGLG